MPSTKAVIEAAADEFFRTAAADAREAAAAVDQHVPKLAKIMRECKVPDSKRAEVAAGYHRVRANYADVDELGSEVARVTQNSLPRVAQSDPP